ncbi:hypothetical protein I6N90_23890 [Paenibacillus sp. GSMTC-2017]|uniref:hypothetical protein n=1 Tax=Paenibacillus sp. GSMTC-2017 TaxID=2794350 RepID=UPI0018D62B25|nr:hypothetical protein [Paenibacillus sp. GSMTC-2017]MBH5320843.1 hypothetical protein [Paenibacillus sp. GSMTC-2017]
MTKVLKRSLTMTLMLMVLVMAMAASAFAATQNYKFYYGGVEHAHSSSYISGPADITSGQVTIKLTGNYFPEVKVGGVSYFGSYNSGTNLTTFVFPGSTSSDIPLDLKVVAGPHNRTYSLVLTWV